MRIRISVLSDEDQCYLTDIRLNESVVLPKNSIRRFYQPIGRVSIQRTK